MQTTRKYRYKLEYGGHLNGRIWYEVEIPVSELEACKTVKERDALIERKVYASAAHLLGLHYEEVEEAAEATAGGRSDG